MVFMRNIFNKTIINYIRKYLKEYILVVLILLKEIGSLNLTIVFKIKTPSFGIILTYNKSFPFLVI